jgi:hypothetical protein
MMGRRADYTVHAAARGRLGPARGSLGPARGRRSGGERGHRPAAIAIVEFPASGKPAFVTLAWPAEFGARLAASYHVAARPAVRQVLAIRYLNVQRLNYMWTIRHSPATIAGHLIT